jgi:hypothetical protein
MKAIPISTRSVYCRGVKLLAVDGELFSYAAALAEDGKWS